MRFLLVNPYCPITEGPTPPLGISYLAAALERAGVDVKVLDLTVFPNTKKVIKSTLDRFKPGIVGVTSVTMTFDSAISTIQTIKDIDPEIITVMGGPHVTFCAEETLKQYPELDLIVLGEGEETIVDIAREYEKSKDWQWIKGLAYRQNDEIKIVPQRPLLDVNTLPLPARHLLPLGRYRALHTPISLTTSRGCPFQCVFCVGRKMVGSKVRYRNPESVVDELEMLSKLNFPQMNISDDLFTAKKSHCIAICEGILERNLKITWSSFARVDTVNKEVLQIMKKAGCSAVSFGVETGNKEILKTIKKGITLEKVKKAIKLCSEVGILPHVSFILGLPGENPSTLNETLEFGRTIGNLGALYGFHLLAPFPGTSVRDENHLYDLDILTDDWTQYHANHAIVETKGITKDELNHIAETWDSETKAKLAEIRNDMEKGIATEKDAWQVLNLDRFLFIYQLMTEEVIENHGSWINGMPPTSDTEALEGLSERICSLMSKSKDQTFDILEYAFKRDSIHFTEEGGKISWDWNNYL